MDLRLERLTLRVSGITEADGRRLVELVGHQLAVATPPASGGATDAMRIAIAPRPGERLESLAERIVLEMLRSLSRSMS